MSLTVALILDPDPASPGTEELCRMIAALVANDQPVRVVCAGAAHGVLGEALATPANERYMDAVEGFGVVPEDLAAAAVLEALAGARDILRAAPGDRAGVPALRVVDAAWLTASASSPEAALAELTAAGQVVRDA